MRDGGGLGKPGDKKGAEDVICLAGGLVTVAFVAASAGFGIGMLV